MFSETVDSKFPPRFDLLPFEGLRRWAEAFGEGSLKYGDGNFRKGMEDRCLLQHALTHLFLYQAGDTTEDHLGHAMWNIGMLCKMEKERPELMVLREQIASECKYREQPVYSADDPRLALKGSVMGMQPESCNVATELTEEVARKLLTEALDTFMHYSEDHIKKGSHEKAASNFEKAQRIARALGFTGAR